MMRFLQTVLAFIAFSFFVSCKKDTPKQCSIPSDPIWIILWTNSGECLFNQSYSDSYKLNDIAISYTDGGSTKYATCSIELYHPSTTIYYLAADINSTDNKGGRRFFLKLSPTDTDTLDVFNTIQTDPNGCSYKELTLFKYNNIVIAPDILGGQALYQITK